MTEHERMRLSVEEYFKMPVLPDRVSVLGPGEETWVSLVSDWDEDKNKTPRLSYYKYKHKFRFGWRVLWRGTGYPPNREIRAVVYQPVIRVKMGRAVQ